MWVWCGRPRRAGRMKDGHEMNRLEEEEGRLCLVVASRRPGQDALV